MSVKVVKEFAPDVKGPRDVYCECLMELAKDNKDIVVLDADLMGAIGTKPFAKAFPEQTIDCGVQEANMIGVACGLSVAGKIPFAHSFGPFIARRANDQIYMSGAYANSNVKLVGSDPGITAQLNGGTHMPFEDMANMRVIPTMTCLEATDCTMLKWMMPIIANTYGMFYLRIVRKSCIKVYEEGSTFELGKAAFLRDGKDVTLIASGYCVSESLKAADILAGEGISARVLDMFCWKPIDEDAINAAAAETGAIVTAENHNVRGGLGSAVAEVLVKNKPVPMEMIGAQDEFGEVGTTAYLAQRFKMTADDIAAAAKKAISRK